LRSKQKTPQIIRKNSRKIRSKQVENWRDIKTKPYTKYYISFITYFLKFFFTFEDFILQF